MPLTPKIWVENSKHTHSRYLVTSSSEFPVKGCARMVQIVKVKSLGKVPGTLEPKMPAKLPPMLPTILGLIAVCKGFGNPATLFGGANTFEIPERHGSKDAGKKTLTFPCGMGGNRCVQDARKPCNCKFATLGQNHREKCVEVSEAKMHAKTPPTLLVIIGAVAACT